MAWGEEGDVAGLLVADIKAGVPTLGFGVSGHDEGN